MYSNIFCLGVATDILQASLKSHSRIHFRMRGMSIAVRVHQVRESLPPTVSDPPGAILLSARPAGSSLPKSESAGIRSFTPPCPQVRAPNRPYMLVRAHGCRSGRHTRRPQRTSVTAIPAFSGRGSLCPLRHVHRGCLCCREGYSPSSHSSPQVAVR